MGLEDDARAINAAKDAVERRRIEQHEAERRTTGTPVRSELTIELAQLIAKHGHPAKVIVEYVSNGRYKRAGTRGWDIGQMVFDSETHSGFRRDPLFCVTTEGYVWGSCETVYRSRAFDTIPKDGALVVKDPMESFATPNEYQRRLFARIVAQALKQDPGGAYLSLPAIDDRR